MKYVDEFRNKNLSLKILSGIKRISPEPKANIMEVCGTHTQSFFRFGLDKLLPRGIKLISGPGCPVCVSPQSYIDNAIRLAKSKDVIIATFGDMLRVPGTVSTLERERANKANVFVVYSAWDSLRLARENPDKKVVFLAVGFETTAPTIALSILEAKRQGLKNIFFFSSLKLIPAAIGYLLKDKRLNIDAFLCPGHVSAVIGTEPYEFIPKKYGISCCVAGFEPTDILAGIHMLMRQLVKNKPKVENQYARVVKRQGNRKALSFMAQVFQVTDADWRGLGRIPKSGLKIKDTFASFNAENVFNIKLSAKRYPLNAKCRCGDVLKGLISPRECSLFAKRCNPKNPIGPCMVSSEGACNAYYRYR